MIRHLALSALLLALIVPARGDDKPPAASPDAPVSFHRQVLPILQRKCQGCHQPDKANGKLNLTTFEALLKGVAKEPDEGFYLGEDVARIRGKTTLDLSVDPPPTLAIEVDNKADTEAALPTYARIRVPEVWRFNARDRTLWFGRLDGQGYEEIGRSLGLPRLTPTLVLEALDAALAICKDELEWHDWLDAWARDLPEPPEGGR